MSSTWCPGGAELPPPAPAALAAFPGRGADPPRAPKFIPTPRRPDPLSKLQMLFSEPYFIFFFCFKDAFVAKSNKCNLLGREGEEFGSADEVWEPRDLLEQICRTTPFPWCLLIPVSKVSLRGALQLRLAKILGADPRE